MEFTEIDQLLSPDALPLEMGIKRLSTGELHVAARSDMQNCKGAMLDWWFGFLETIEHYRWWHPQDHKGLQWDDKWKPGSYIGATCVVDESLCGGEVHRLHIKFHDPADIFSAEKIASAKANGGVAALVCATIGFGMNPITDSLGNMIGARFIHAAYDTPSGCALRNRFWLGAGINAAPDVVAQAAPEPLGLALMQHANSEYTMLSRFLPALYFGQKYNQLTDMRLAW